jgi:hypothetical protein
MVLDPDVDLDVDIDVDLNNAVWCNISQMSHL